MIQTKRFWALLLALCMALSLCACGGEDDTPATTEVTETEAVTATVPETPEETEPAVDDGSVTYTVTVVDEDGNPIAGAMVQICMDTCYPGVTGADGSVQFSVAEADYKVSFLSLPAGYTYSTEEQEFYFENGSTEITLTLKAEG